MNFTARLPWIIPVPWLMGWRRFQRNREYISAAAAAIVNPRQLSDIPLRVDGRGRSGHPGRSSRAGKGVRFAEAVRAMITPLCSKAADVPSSAGAYVLAIRLAKPFTVTIAGRRAGALAAGRYLYCGSANGPGGLKSRLSRHRRRGKAIRWHIDQLTEHGSVEGAWMFPGGDECDLVAALSHLPMPMPGFGSTDCRRCRSHLLAWSDEALPWPSSIGMNEAA